MRYIIADGCSSRVHYFQRAMRRAEVYKRRGDAFMKQFCLLTTMALALAGGDRRRAAGFELRSAYWVLRNREGRRRRRLRLRLRGFRGTTL